MVLPSGTIASSAGPITFAADSLAITFHGRGAHGSTPQSSIDPVIMACSAVLRLQTIVSREIAATDQAVVTVGSIQAGDKDNVIPDKAVLKMNIRTLDEGVRKRVLSAVERIVKAEAQASGATREPEIETIDSYPLNVNDKPASERVYGAMKGYFDAPAESPGAGTGGSDDEENQKGGAPRVQHTGPNPASEDFGCFGTSLGVPSVYWFVGGTDPSTYAKAKEEGKVQELPVNHSPQFAPVLHPTLETGVQAMAVAAMAWLGKA